MLTWAQEVHIQGLNAVGHSLIHPSLVPFTFSPLCLVFLVHFVHSDWVVRVKSWDRVTHVHVDTDYTVLPSLCFEGLYHGKSHSP